MKAIVIEKYGNENEFKEVEMDRPVPKAGQVLIEVKAASVNPLDWKVREGYLKDRLPLRFPAILGWDAAGVIVETGSGVSAFKKGDAVFAKTETNENGTYADYTCIEEEKLAKMPERLSFSEAASVPLAGLTAWQVLNDVADVQDGDNVLILGGAGGVGSFAVQIAKHKGAYVAATASEENQGFLKSIGADHPIDYKKENPADLLSDVDLIFDLVGGLTAEKALPALKEGGLLVSVAGNPDTEAARSRNIRTVYHSIEASGKQLQEISALLQLDMIVPVVTEVLPMTAAGVKQAHQSSQEGHVRGKLVLNNQK
ncbi:NADP-dependent oxidoreductase [Sinobaca sp. H24]|uniref:NADP-dependent oxidoreductase n=1 Tax=Sinobaca sp. H24 TaxID=2923376 RepID=UPI002079DD5A|nr:NADP-dependent oxidoreductase [Sinobaca sp. H24]